MLDNYRKKMLISIQIHEYKSSRFNLHNLLNFRCLQVCSNSEKNQNLVFRFVLKTENLSLLYRPWCPTELDEQLNVIEWGDCMDYCPTEPVNSACLEEPEFPVFSDGTGLTANYTSTYERGSGIVTDEVCENIFFLLLFLNL